MTSLLSSDISLEGNTSEQEQEQGDGDGMVSDNDDLEDFQPPGLTFDTEPTNNNGGPARYAASVTDQGTQQLITYLTAQADESRRQVEAKDKQMDLVMKQMAEQNRLLQERLLSQTPAPSTSQPAKTKSLVEVSH